MVPAGGGGGGVLHRIHGGVGGVTGVGSIVRAGGGDAGGAGQGGAAVGARARSRSLGIRRVRLLERGELGARQRPQVGGDGGRDSDAGRGQLCRGRGARDDQAGGRGLGEDGGVGEPLLGRVHAGGGGREPGDGRGVLRAVPG